MKKVALILAIIASVTVVGFAAKADTTSTIGKAYELMEYWQYDWAGGYDKMFEPTGGSTYINPSTIRFDALTLPAAGSTVTSALLTFGFNNDPGSGYYEAAPGSTLELGRVTETYTAPSAPGTTSNVPLSWTTLGHVPADAATITLTSNGQGKQFIDITPIVQYWVDHPTENFGIVVKSTTIARYHTPQQTNNGSDDGYGGIRQDGSGDLVVTFTPGSTGASVLTASPASGATLDFTSNLPDRSKTLTSAVTLTNSGTAGTTLLLTGADITGANAAMFTFSGTTGTPVDAAGTNYNVNFLGTHLPGTYTATLALTTDAATANIATYTLSAVVARLIGDANLDNAVNFTDYLALEQTFNTAVANDTGADFTKDGLVNFSDYLALEQNFNTSGAAVPEPMTLSLLGLGALALIRRRK